MYSPIVFVFTFILGMFASAKPGMAVGSGLATLGAMIFFGAVFAAFSEPTEAPFRFSLSILGAYFGAGLIYILDWAAREAGWPG